MDRTGNTGFEDEPMKIQNVWAFTNFWMEETGETGPTTIRPNKVLTMTRTR